MSEDLDFQCGHCSPGELIESDSTPVGQADKLYSEVRAWESQWSAPKALS